MWDVYQISDTDVLQYKPGYGQVSTRKMNSILIRASSGTGCTVPSLPISLCIRADALTLNLGLERACETDEQIPAHVPFFITSVRFSHVRIMIRRQAISLSYDHLQSTGTWKARAAAIAVSIRLGMSCHSNKHWSMWSARWSTRYGHYWKTTSRSANITHTLSIRQLCRAKYGCWDLWNCSSATDKIWREQLENLWNALSGFSGFSMRNESHQAFQAEPRCSVSTISAPQRRWVNACQVKHMSQNINHGRFHLLHSL